MPSASLNKKEIHLHRDRYLRHVFELFITKEMLQFRADMLLGFDNDRISRVHELHRDEVDTLILKVLRSREGNLGRLILNGASPLLKALAIDRFVETLSIMSDYDTKQTPRWSLKTPYCQASYALLFLAPFDLEHLDQKENG